MTIGIYSLMWLNQEVLYVGQSVAIETRYKKHLWMLSNGTHDNYKVQNTYNLHGSPTLVILEELPTSDLDDREDFWIKEFTGPCLLNLCAAEPSRSGLSATNSKYTKLQLLLVFRALRNYRTSYEDISTKFGVGGSTIRSIAMGTQHTWLHSKYPNIWKQIQEVSSKKLSYKNSLVNLGKKVRTLVSPVGTEHKIENISEFCREHKLWTSTVCRMLQGKVKTTKGWHLKNELD